MRSGAVCLLRSYQRNVNHLLGTHRVRFKSSPNYIDQVTCKLGCNCLIVVGPGHIRSNNGPSNYLVDVCLVISVLLRRYMVSGTCKIITKLS